MRRAVVLFRHGVIGLLKLKATHTATSLHIRGFNMAAPETITLLVHKLECAPNVQLFGTQDPFVIAQLQVTDAVEVDPDGSFACTDWVQNGGCSCTWTAEHSNELQLKCSATDPKNISILLDVWNANALVDDRIAGTSVSLDSINSGERTFLQLQPGGVLEVTISHSVADSTGSNPLFKFAEGVMNTKRRDKLQIVLHGAEELPDAQFLFPQDPYVEAWLVRSTDSEGGAEESIAVAKTAAHQGGGVNPSWSDGQDRTVAVVPDKGTTGLRVLVKNSNLLLDDTIASVLVPIDMDLIGSSFSIAQPLDERCELTLEQGGKLHCTFSICRGGEEAEEGAETETSHTEY